MVTDFAGMCGKRLLKFALVHGVTWNWPSILLQD
jgi:hypothetical protein